MVVFTCGHCGESVQKPKVEKHYLTKCRNRNPNLSCMDCFKDFLGNDYESHIKCITEEERYSGKGFQAKEKKGEKKQNAWVDMVQSVLDEEKNAPKNVLRIIEAISKHNNTPRKKPKFINFVKNVCGQKTNPKDIDQAWNLISVKLSALSNLNQNKNNTANGTSENETNGKSSDLDDSQIQKEKDEIQNENDEVENDKDNFVKNSNGNINKDQNDDTQTANPKKLSKKERKEEKKRLKYEAELQSAEAAPAEPEVEEAQVVSKKGKKKKNKSESENNDGATTEVTSKNKNKKRKRQDTVNSVPEVPNNEDENVENVPLSKEKTVKKKLKIGENEEADESLCLHDQNVAKIEELSMKNEVFNWHACIMSVLQKKGEAPFKRLQKKVLFEYSEATGQEVDDRIADKFIKKLKSAPNVRVDKNRVVLIE